MILLFRFVQGPLMYQTNTAIFSSYRGGGSGHEPFTFGYIGQGGLCACVVGDVFAAPSPLTIYKAIKTCAHEQNNGGGALLIVTNYTGKHKISVLNRVFF